ncbi:hypothetical protein [Saccharicrinis fermentans]|uniref:Uncharacterized protein n=1 Tax=Saccharicrinis fermentans DSM 9555 = JCM 21142 TaxID=869213 RepID=W7YEE4_9BACT|nr:hypothetical protein [Saccharicrinis fermentans]GAF05848.1 hypothetical protein JCM21142_114602 [Saccharicrinis fermentans DSM 9555 = JCM 21142]
MATGYVTNYGNSENDGLSWDTPKRSIQSAIDAGLSPIYVKGYHNESLAETSARHIYGDGYIIIDGTLLSNFISYINYSYFLGLRIQNFDKLCSSNLFRATYRDVIFSKIGYIYYKDDTIERAAQSCLFDSITTELVITGYAIRYNNTFYNSKISLSTFGCNSTYTYSNVYSECDLNIQISPKFQYSLFHNCTFKFTGGDQDADETDYAAPVGDTDDDKLENIRTRMATVYGGSSSDYLIGCKYQTDGDLFIDADNENFYLVPGCTAASMSYKASYVGKYPEGAVAEIPADFTTYTNIDDDGNITDQTTNAYAETAIQDIGKLRHVNTLKALGERAVRNGNQVNADADLGDAIYPGTDLTDGSTYIVRTEAISLTASGTTRDVGETFIASADDGLAFTSDTGYVQEVYLDKPRCVEIKASKTDATLASATWIKLDLYETPYVNYDENGLISAGNLDEGYDADAAEKMYIRYWKARIYVQAQNLPG